LVVKDSFPKLQTKNQKTGELVGNGLTFCPAFEEYLSFRGFSFWES
jgi:hypothetical protein